MKTTDFHEYEHHFSDSRTFFLCKWRNLQGCPRFSDNNNQTTKTI